MSDKRHRSKQTVSTNKTNNLSQQASPTTFPPLPYGQSMTFQGPIPHPQILQGFENIVPGAARELIDLAASESRHRREIETKALDSNAWAQKQQLEIANYQNRVTFQLGIIGQVCGALIALISILAVVYLAMNEHETAAYVVALIPIGAIIRSFSPEKIQFFKKT